LVALGLLACGTARAQVTTAPAEPQPAAARPAAASTPESRRQDIKSMEVLLTQALQKGAQDLARALKVSAPNSAFVTGTGRARGFILEGHGIFFDVDVPGMRQSVVWSAQMLELEQQRQNIRRFLANSSPDDPRRKIAEANLRSIERSMGTAPGEIVISNPTTNTQLVPQDRIAAAVAVAEGTLPAGAAGSPAPAAPPPPPAPMPQLRDPNELYTESVKNALIDAMLRYSGFLKVGDTEWLTVAASDSDGPQAPGQVDEAVRILISIRGSDLTAFQSGKLTRDEVLKKVEVREF
jgi:hypothetical protein